MIQWCWLRNTVFTRWSCWKMWQLAIWQFDEFTRWVVEMLNDHYSSDASRLVLLVELDPVAPLRNLSSAKREKRKMESCAFLEFHFGFIRIGIGMYEGCIGMSHLLSCRHHCRTGGVWGIVFVLLVPSKQGVFATILKPCYCCSCVQSTFCLLSWNLL